jgi:aminopeptidase 2
MLFNEVADDSVWSEILTRVTALKMAWIFEPKDVRDALTAMTRELTAPKAKSLGWDINEDDDHIRRQFKAVCSPIDRLMIANVHDGRISTR